MAAYLGRKFKIEGLYGRFTLLYSRNAYNIVKQPYANKYLKRKNYRHGVISKLLENTYASSNRFEKPKFAKKEKMIF